jgi:acetyl esterase/lipase
VRSGGVATWRAVEYAVVPGYRPLLLDLHRPDTAETVPLVLFLHGGGWRVGSRGAVGPAFADWDPSPFAQLVQAGFAVASVDYRLSGEARFPAQLDDVTAALAWLRAHAAELGLDTGRTAVWGESAGGHLAALLGLTVPGVRAVADWYGPADLAALPADAAATGIAVTDPGAPDSRETLLLGAPPQAAPELARAASPAARVHAGAPSFLLVHGTADRFVPSRQSERLAEALAAAGTPADLHLLEGADHMWLGPPGHARTAFDLTLAFLRHHLS